MGSKKSHRSKDKKGNKNNKEGESSRPTDNNNNNNEKEEQEEAETATSIIRKGTKTVDPDGSVNIARGTTSDIDVLRKRRLELLEKMEETVDDDGDDDIDKDGDNNNQKKKKKKKATTSKKYRDQALPTELNDVLSATKKQQRHRKKEKIMDAEMEKKSTKLVEATMDKIDAQVVLNTAQRGLLEAEHDMERTTALTQTQLKRMLTNSGDTKTARHIYDITLEDTAPYGCKYDRSGRYGLLYGCKNTNSSSHIAIMDCHNTSLQHEFYLHSNAVRDVCFLHNSTLFAAAQKSHVFVYDHQGTEIHQLKDHVDPLRVDYLPYHFLLVSIGRSGWLKYHDVSTGELVSKHRTKLGACSVLRQNPNNAIVHCGHSNGTVTLWSPASSQYLVKMLCHKGSPITSMAIASSSGGGGGGSRHSLSSSVMVTGGSDHQIRVWDLRMYRELFSYFVPSGTGPPGSLDISQTGVLGIGHGCHGTFWSSDALRVKQKDPYMHHKMPGCAPVQTLRFRPNEDVCAIGHQKGISSIVVPGSGEPNIDTLEYNNHGNPYNRDGAAKANREAEVKALLDKLSPNTIALDHDRANKIGGLEQTDNATRLEQIRDKLPQREEAQKKKKTKKRGQSKIATQLRRKQKNVIDQQTIKLRQARELEKQQERHERKQKDNANNSNNRRYYDDDAEGEEKVPGALKRFLS